MPAPAPPIGSDGSASHNRGACLFPLTLSDKPCGVENLTRKLVAAVNASDPTAPCELLAISGRWCELPSVMRKIAGAEAIVFSLPLVAWKRMIVLPLTVNITIIY